MACIAPITMDGPHGPIMARCKQCLPCRIYRQSSLSLQCVLENRSAWSGQFVTLTYRDAPEVGTYEDFSLFLKRLRIRNRRRGNTDTIRYLGCGEYGAKSGRFHYHGLIWNSLPFDQEVWSTALWPHGFSYIGTVTPSSIRYTARYCLKFEAKGEEAVSGYSLKPVLGAPLMTQLGAKYLDQGHRLRTPPAVLTIDGKTYPVNRAMQIAFAEGYNPDWITRNAAGTRTLVRSGAKAHLDWLVDKKLGDPVADQRKRNEAKAYFWETARSHGSI